MCMCIYLYGRPGRWIFACNRAGCGAALENLPQDIWITGTIQRGKGQYAPGAYTTMLLDRPSTSPLR
jgi:hypothetical protein